jgi:hypothetical protein
MIDAIYRAKYGEPGPVKLPVTLLETVRQSVRPASLLESNKPVKESNKEKAGKFDKAAYQREYMRRRRAKK